MMQRILVFGGALLALLTVYLLMVLPYSHWLYLITFIGLTGGMAAIYSTLRIIWEIEVQAAEKAFWRDRKPPARR